MSDEDIREWILESSVSGECIYVRGQFSFTPTSATVNCRCVAAPSIVKEDNADSVILVGMRDGIILHLEEYVSLATPATAYSQGQLFTCVNCLSKHVDNVIEYSGWEDLTLHEFGRVHRCQVCGHVLSLGVLRSVICAELESANRMAASAPDNYGTLGSVLESLLLLWKCVQHWDHDMVDDEWWSIKPKNKGHIIVNGVEWLRDNLLQTSYVLDKVDKLYSAK